MVEYLEPKLFASFQVAKAFKDNTRSINSIDWDKGGNFLLTASDDESIRIYNAQSGKSHNVIHSKKYGCSHARFAHRSNNILHASSKEDDAIRYLSQHDNKYLSYFKGHSGKVTSLEISPISDDFISASAVDSTVRFWNLNTRDATGIIEIKGHHNPLLAYDPTGMVFALALSNNAIRMYALGSPGSPPFISVDFSDNLLPLGSTIEMTKISFSNDGKFLLISTKTNVLYLLDAFTAKIHRRLTGHTNSGLALEACFTPDARYVICGSLDGKIFAWEVSNGTKIADFTYHSDPPKIVSFSPTTLIMASGDSTLALWQPSIMPGGR